MPLNFIKFRFNDKIIKEILWKRKQTSRVSRIEEFLLDPEKTIFELLEEFENSVEENKKCFITSRCRNLEN